ncbi:UDP-N-acetylmuramate--L-alanine ligase [Marisediminicola senii]|uniref:UDP-N-acetylmuramate--L-alanine ligase n=1 Tax=Marisediminicola senii TaxID=2711233 RepID=UPI0038B2AB33
MIKSDFSQTMPDQPGRVHFVGIGGAGMSGIARLFAAAGFAVSGSDIRATETVEALRASGVPIAIGHDAGNIADADTLVVTGAIAENNPEYLEAKRRGLPVVHRARALAWLTRNDRVVAVAGAHGKTTSSAMVIEALLALGADPSFVNGGVIRSLGVSAESGADDLFVVEADESDGSFQLYTTTVALITNVDPDHLDHYGSAEAFDDAFVSFARAASGFVVISSDDPGAVRITPRLDGQAVVAFGEAANADVRVHSITTAAGVSFTIAYRGQDYPVTLRVPGLHNALNAAGAFAVLTGLGYEPRAALDAVATFGGTERRFEFRGEARGVSVYDDFAHHPTEVRAALTAARGAAADGRLIVLFQPHLYSRTRMLADDFAAVFRDLAEYTVVVPIYGARQDPEPGVTGELISSRFHDATRGTYIEGWDDAVAHVASIARTGDIVIPMGGGDIYLVIPRLLEALANGSGAADRTAEGAPAADTTDSAQ